MEYVTELITCHIWTFERGKFENMRDKITFTIHLN